MEHRPKQKGETVKFVKVPIENLADLESDSEFLGTKPKEWTMKKKTNRRDVIKVKTSSLAKTLLEWKDKSHPGQKCL